jgi:hypothetical protein
MRNGNVLVVAPEHFEEPNARDENPPTYSYGWNLPSPRGFVGALARDSGEQCCLGHCDYDRAFAHETGGGN